MMLLLACLRLQMRFAGAESKQLTGSQQQQRQRRLRLRQRQPATHTERTMPAFSWLAHSFIRSFVRSVGRSLAAA